MTILIKDDHWQIEAVWVMRGGQALDEANAARLDNWKRRYFRDPVTIPASVQPPKWPVTRCSISAPDNIEILSKRRKAK